MKTRTPKLLVIDLDGTVLGGGHVPYARLPDHVSRFLDALSELDWEWAINTTWDGPGQWELVRTSAIKSRPAFLMAEFGLRVWEPNPDSDGIRPAAYNGAMEEKLRLAQPAMHGLLKDCVDGFIPEPGGLSYYGHFLSFKARKEDEERFNAFAASLNFAARGLREHHASDRRVAATPDFIDKGKALAEVARVRGFTPDQIVVAGDGDPDIAMMNPAWAKYAISPANATDRVKDHVSSIDGLISDQLFGTGVIDAFTQLARREGWDLGS